MGGIMGIMDRIMVAVVAAAEEEEGKPISSATMLSYFSSY
jgi:hypothetical protein